MANVVQQGSQSYEATMLLVDVELLAQFSRDVDNTERMLGARVHRAWIDQMCHRQLPDPPEPLEDRRVDDVALASFDADEPVNGVAEVTMRRH